MKLLNIHFRNSVFSHIFRKTEACELPHNGILDCAVVATCWYVLSHQRYMVISMEPKLSYDDIYTKQK